MIFTVVFAKQAISKKPEKENNTGFSETFWHGVCITFFLPICHFVRVFFGILFQCIRAHCRSKEQGLPLNRTSETVTNSTNI